MNTFSSFRFRLGLIGILLVALSLLGCRKYEDGPTFSLLSKRARAANNWAAISINRNNIDETSLFGTYQLDLLDDGNFTWRFQLVDDSLNTEEITGVWEITSAKEQIRLTFDEAQPDTGRELLFMTISRLTSSELWVEYLYDEDYYDVRLE